MNKEQKYVRINRNVTKDGPPFWLLSEAGGTSYLASQCTGHSGLEKDLSNGWIIKHCWEDCYQIVLVLERIK